MVSSASGREIFDSGYKLGEIYKLVGEFTDDSVREMNDPGMFVAVCLGLLEGDMMALSEYGTLMLPEPRAAIEARIAKVRKLRATGLTMAQVLERLA